MKALVISAAIVCGLATGASAQSPAPQNPAPQNPAAQNPEDLAVAACQSTGLIALQQRSKDITDLIIDRDSLAVTTANTKVEDVAIKAVVLGEAYIKRDKETGKPDRFVCLIGDKGKVLLTFFTAK
jgi:hypothetical protein